MIFNQPIKLKAYCLSHDTSSSILEFYKTPKEEDYMNDDKIEEIFEDHNYKV